MTERLQATVACCLMLGAWPAALVSQEGPELALDVVLALSIESGGDTLAVGAGIIVGTSGTSVYFVTAAHLLNGRETGDSVLVGTRGGPTQPAEILHTSPFSDLAAGVFGIGDAAWQTPTKTASWGDILFSDQPVFALGCPRGRCWGQPEEARTVEDPSINLVFRSPFLEPGLSGGPVVDASGGVVGLTLSSTFPLGRALWWFHISRALADWGIPENLPGVPAHSSGSTTTGVVPMLLPHGARAIDGSRIIPGAVVEFFAVRWLWNVQGVADAVMGFHRLSYDGRDELGVVRDFVAVGGRVGGVLPISVLARSPRDVLTVGFDLLFGSRAKHVERVEVPGVVDFRTGEPLRERVVLESEGGSVGSAVYAEYQAHVTAVLALRARVSYYSPGGEFGTKSGDGFFRFGLGGLVRLPRESR